MLLLSLAHQRSRAALQYTGNPENERQRRHLLAALDLAHTRPLDAGQRVILTGNLLGTLYILELARAAKYVAVDTDQGYGPMNQYQLVNPGDAESSLKPVP